MKSWLHVFRVRGEQFEQADLFEGDRVAKEVIADSLLQMPAGEIGGGSEWHIAAAQQISGGAILFQIGRVQQVSNPQYDDVTKKFYEADGERAPYAYGVYDRETQACVIEKKSQVSGKAIEIGSKLEKLINIPQSASESGFRLVVDELRDPDGFIEQVKRAYKVKRFSFDAEFENPHDVGKLIHRPAEKYNELIGGVKTKVETRGDALDKSVVEDMARSAASVGDPASATIIDEPEAKPKTVYLRGTPLLEVFEFPDALGNLGSAMLAALRSAYARIRNSADD